MNENEVIITLVELQLIVEYQSVRGFLNGF